MRLTRKKIIVSVLLVLFVAGAAAFSYWLQAQGVKPIETADVIKGTLQRSVDVIGSLKPETTVDLSFQKAGVVAKVNGVIGTEVKKGDVLAALENSAEDAALKQAQAVLSEAQANLNLKNASSTTEDRAIASADVSQAKANLDKTNVDRENAESNLENVRKTVTQDIKVAELDLKNAKLNLEQVKVSAGTTDTQAVSTLSNSIYSLRSTLGQSLSAVLNGISTVDKIFGVYGNSVFMGKGYLIREGSSLYIETHDLLIKNNTSYIALKALYDNLPAEPEGKDMEALIAGMGPLTSDMRDMLLKALDLTNSAILSVDFSQSSLDKLKSDIATAQTTFNSAITVYDAARTGYDNAVISAGGNEQSSPLTISGAELLVSQKEQALEKIKINGNVQITTAENQVRGLLSQVEVQKALVNRAEASMDKVQASPRSVDVAPYSARVTQAQAGVQKAQSDYDKTLLKAPMDGLVTARDVEVGEQVSAVSGGVNTKTAFTMINRQNYYVEVDVPEIQIDKIDLNSKVSITFDAIESDVPYEGQIVSIEPAATLIQDIVYYKVKVMLKMKEDRLKDGMTANVTISAAPKTDVLLIPETALITLDGLRYVNVMKADGTIEMIKIKPGLHGDNGMMEVLEGLTEGMKVVTSKIQ